MKVPTLFVILGLESFNFKKTIGNCRQYRGGPFTVILKTSHKLLVYLTNWYWGWLEHNLVFATSNLHDPRDKMKIAIQLLVEGPVYEKK